VTEIYVGSLADDAISLNAAFDGDDGAIWQLIPSLVNEADDGNPEVTREVTKYVPAGNPVSVIIVAPEDGKDVPPPVVE
jgi:hypothetical protein